MDLELVTIGTELLLGHTVDSNAADLSRVLTAVGARVVRTSTVGDDHAAIVAAVRDALARAGFVVTTGGLGPTHDDVTKHAVAAVYEVPMVRDEAYERLLEERWQTLRRPGTMPESNRTQALLPRGAERLRNPRGTAPGLWLEGPPGTVVMLPGVPEEARGLVAEEVAPRLAHRISDTAVVTRSYLLRTAGIAESALADRLEGVEQMLAPVTLAYLPTLDGVDLRFTAWGVAAGRADAMLDEAIGRVRPKLGDHCYGADGADLAGHVLHLLEQKRLRLAVAESCTGGLVGARLTAVPGASAAFVGGVVAYDDAVKVTQLGVSEELLAAHGAVSEAVVAAMVHGVCDRFGVEAGLAVSGVAGPGGGTDDKPVGTVCLAAQIGARNRVVTVRVPGDRYQIRARAVQGALFLLRQVIGGSWSAG